MGFFKRNGFHSREQIAAFLTVVFSGQIIYSAFESFKIPFYQRLVEYYDLTDTQFGLLFTMLGVAVFFYIPGGWVNNRFNARTVLMVGLAYRCATALFMILVKPAFSVMLAITFTWGIVDAIFWPAVVKGVVLFSSKSHKGFALGTLTAFRAGGEAVLNGVMIAVMSLAHGSLLAFRSGMVVYALLTLPLIALIYRYVPADPQEDGDVSENAETVEVSSKEALTGLIQTLKIPRVWLAGFAGMNVYWVYTTLIYTTPYFVRVFGMGTETAALYATVNAVLLGLGGGLVGGIVADRVFKSSALTLAVTLCGGAVFLLGLALLPGDRGNMIFALVLISLFVFLTMMAKGIQQAPVAELNLPNSIVGSAMSVNSFLAFACILWATTLNGSILDAYRDDPATGFSIIFLMMAVVALVGAALSWWLVVLNRRHLHVLETSEEVL
ncbi:MFS transporter [Arcanobacterium phocisimile]|uniref:MFS transporter n=1 Tax=Arcanobacterium phocisimile TaxID=1302235 RepID=A0ABX7IHU2_9ACTO|nr:MFS transporter [Arcanobacterium phocisimile]QRV02410.1 MFS transporter [Arcanobacterium phocisimile]